MKIFYHLKHLFLHILVILFEKFCDFLMKQFKVNPDDFDPEQDDCFSDCDIDEVL